MAANNGDTIANPLRGPTINCEVVVPDPVSVMLALFVRVIEPLILPSIVIAILCRFSPLNWGQTTLLLSSVGPLSVEQVTVMIVADAVPERARGANMKISFVIERITDFLQ